MDNYNNNNINVNKEREQNYRCTRNVLHSEVAINSVELKLQQ